MQAVRSLKNQYLGINAHLHSYWQVRGGWNNFHNRYIGDLAGMLRLSLLPMGYTAIMEDSLQIRRTGDTPRTPRADILISDLDPVRPLSVLNTKSVELTVADVVEMDEDAEHPYRALAIYAQRSEAQGLPLAWIELLSPTNKGHTPDAFAYLAKRRLLLEQGCVYVEIDYLHETPPTIAYVDDYSQHPTDLANPYRIIVLDPRPDVTTGPAHIYEFRVDDPIPDVPIPLNADDSVNADFGAAYTKTFQEMGYGLEPTLIDYTNLPLNFDDHYAPIDQQRIAVRMLAVLEAAQANLDLNAAPFPVPPLTLPDALQRITMLTA